MKKLLTMAIVVTLMAVSVPANAKNLKNSTVDRPTLAILDTALDTSIPQIKEKLIGEVCILDWNTCPNGQAFMEGEGASVLPMNILTNSNFSHGTKMASIAVAKNPDMNILFIRIIGNTSTGSRQITKATLVPRVLDWIADNKDKYNIKAVSMSQGHHNLLRGSTADQYCPKNPGLDASLRKLAALDMPVFFASGNNRDVRIDWPACSAEPNVIAVGGTEAWGSVALYSNYDPDRLDFYDVGSTQIINPGGSTGYAAGTSVATPSIAAKWLIIKSSKPTLSLPEIYSLISKTGKFVTNSKQSSGIEINLMSALNG